jgi:hypothetical protein
MDQHNNYDDFKEENLLLVVPLREFQEIIAQEFKDSDLLGSVAQTTVNVRQPIL